MGIITAVHKQDGLSSTHFWTPLLVTEQCR